MAGATVSKTIGPDGAYTADDLAGLAVQLGLPVDECYFEINAINNGVRTLSARARSRSDSAQDVTNLPVPSADYVRTKMPSAE
jgi:hypothetical protein